MQIRNRIKEFIQVPARELVPNPKNWRTHPDAQKDALKGVLAEIGYADALIARRLNNGQLQLIDGHLRAETTPDQAVPVLVLDLDENEADKLLALLDPLSAMAGTDSQLLDELTANLETQNEAVRNLIENMRAEALNDFASDGSDTESDESDSDGSYADPKEVAVPELFQILVACEDESQQRELFERLNQEGYKCKFLNL